MYCDVANADETIIWRQAPRLTTPACPYLILGRSGSRLQPGLGSRDIFIFCRGRIWSQLLIRVATGGGVVNTNNHGSDFHVQLVLGVAIPFTRDPLLQNCYIRECQLCRFRIFRESGAMSHKKRARLASPDCNTFLSFQCLGPRYFYL